MNEIIVEQKEQYITTVSLNRPHARNAINIQMWLGLKEIFSEIGQDNSTRVVILKGVDDTQFSSGADINEFNVRLTTVDDAHRYWKIVDDANSAIEDCKKPVIAEIRGFALGAAYALAIACDLRIAASASRVGVPAAKLGLILGLNDTRRLVNALGQAVAAEVLILGRIYTASEALLKGLLNEVVSSNTLESHTLTWARDISASSPYAIEQAKANLAIVRRNPGLVAISVDELPIVWADAGREELRQRVEAFQQKSKRRDTL